MTIVLVLQIYHAFENIIRATLLQIRLSHLMKNIHNITHNIFVGTVCDENVWVYLSLPP